MEKVDDCQTNLESLDTGNAVMMFFPFFKRRFAAKAKAKADGDLLIDLFGDGALAMATENAVKSAADGPHDTFAVEEARLGEFYAAIRSNMLEQIHAIAAQAPSRLKASMVALSTLNSLMPVFLATRHQYAP